MSEINCVICGKIFRTLGEQYGKRKYPICLSCFLELNEKDNFGTYEMLCDEMFAGGNFAEELESYISGAKALKEMNEQLTKDLEEELNGK